MRILQQACQLLRRFRAGVKAFPMPRCSCRDELAVCWRPREIGGARHSEPARTTVARASRLFSLKYATPPLLWMDCRGMCSLVRRRCVCLGTRFAGCMMLAGRRSRISRPGKRSVWTASTENHCAHNWPATALCFVAEVHDHVSRARPLYVFCFEETIPNELAHCTSTSPWPHPAESLHHTQDCSAQRIHERGRVGGRPSPTRLWVVGQAQPD